MTVIDMKEWKKGHNPTVVSVTFEYEDCAKAFVEYFTRANVKARSGLTASLNGKRVTFKIPSDHHEMSNIIVVATARFFEAGYKTAYGDISS